MCSLWLIVIIRILNKAQQGRQVCSLASSLAMLTCKGYGIAVKGSWYDHETPPVIENERVKILWDFSVQTDRTIKANRPDIIIHEKETNKCYLIDVSVPSDRNTSLKSFEKA